MRSLDEGWTLRMVTESLPDLTNGDFENGFADKSPRPDSVKKVLLCDEFAWMPQQIFEHCKRLRSELYRLCAFAQALVGDIEAKTIEEYTFFVRHRSLPKSTDLRRGWQYGRRPATIYDIVGPLTFLPLAFTETLPDVNNRFMTFVSTKR